MTAAADNANVVRRIHRESGPIYGDEGFDAALDALQTQLEAAAAERDAYAKQSEEQAVEAGKWRKRADTADHNLRLSREAHWATVAEKQAAEAERDLAVRQRDQLLDAAKNMCYFLAPVQVEKDSPVFGVYNALADAIRRIDDL